MRRNMSDSIFVHKEHVPMSLRDTMRRAASLLVEMPPATPEPEATASAVTTGPAASKSGAAAEPDLEELLSVLDNDRRSGQASAPTATPPRGAAPARTGGATGSMPAAGAAAGAGASAAPRPGATKTVE